MAATESEQFGRIEARGIDAVPLDERHGKPSSLFWVWAAANVNYLYVVLGGLLMVFGLNVWQGLAVVVVGNLWWAVIGFLAISGPAAGTPSSVVSRSMFGIRGNRVYTGVFNWPTFIAYEAINLSLGILMVHGWGYVVYLFADFRIWSLMRWSFPKFLLIALGGVIPFLSFFLEVRIVREVKAYLASRTAPADTTPQSVEASH